MKDSRFQSFVEMARALPPVEQVPYAFEKRVLARIREISSDPWAAWSGLMWRAAVACLMISLGAGLLSASRAEPKAGELVASDLEEVVFAPLHASAEGELW